jgi:hypothetical protein
MQAISEILARYVGSGIICTLLLFLPCPSFCACTEIETRVRVLDGEFDRLPGIQVCTYSMCLYEDAGIGEKARGLKLNIFGEPRRMRGFGGLTLFLHNFQSLMQEERE